jgi:hypothetical protein
MRSRPTYECGLQKPIAWCATMIAQAMSAAFAFSPRGACRAARAIPFTDPSNARRKLLLQNTHQCRLAPVHGHVTNAESSKNATGWGCAGLARPGKARATVDERRSRDRRIG